jgi:2-polyprenyl-6-hydroxyphenyl methylase/3-demethylubiquinone-9 3-methyltransferase
MPTNNRVYDGEGDVWWDEQSPLSCLHTSLNPARFPYFREVLLERLGWRVQGLRALDVGCGGGLLAEEFARLGLAVTGVDPSANSLATARRHAAASGLEIDYEQAVGESLPFDDARFDVVYCCDVLEHVSNVDLVVGQIARVLRPGGAFLFDTINRTTASKLATITVAQKWLKLAPPDFHVWEMYITPTELERVLTVHGLVQQDLVGLRPGGNPIALMIAARRVRRGQMSVGELGRRAPWVRTKSTAISYMGYALKVS